MNKYMGIIFFVSFLILGIMSFVGSVADQAYVASGLALMLVVAVVYGLVCEIKDWKWLNR